MKIILYGGLYGHIYISGSTMEIEMDFVYSPCGKYVFAAKEFPEEVFDFLEIEY